MAYRKTTLLKFSTLLLATALFGRVAGELPKQGTALAQSFGDVPDSFPISEDLPGDAVLNIDGTTSMAVVNETLQQRFEQQFPNNPVDLKTSSSDTALEELVNGDLDLAAVGRPLTEAEQNQGLVAVPIGREKIAIIVGPNNPFEGELSFEQFARMFRGEISDWSEVGAPAGAVRFVDRPEASDTRRALSQYEVFMSRPFQPGATADPVSVDETNAVIEALGPDGIGYAVVSQVQGRNDVRILRMHQTLPDDPRYPYSQYRSYVYNSQNSTPEALAFLGFATTEPGREVFATATAPTPEPTPVATAEPAATPTPVPAATADGAATALVPEAAPAGRGRFPWWLLGIPILGGLLWWLLKGKGASAPVVAPVVPPVAAVIPEDSRIILTPRNCRRAYAYWEVSNEHRASQRDRGGRQLMLRLFDVTDRDPERHPPVRIDQFEVTEDQQDLHMPIPVDDRDYRVELGYVTGEDHWLPLAKSDPVRVPVCPKAEPGTAAVLDAGPDRVDRKFTGTILAGGAALAGAAVAGGLLGRQGEAQVLPAADPSRIILTPRTQDRAYAYWEVSDRTQAAAKAEGGRDYQLRIYDATDIDLDRQPAHDIMIYPVYETDQDRFVPIAAPNRDYVADIGYETEGGDWLSLARSAPVRMPAVVPALPTSGFDPAATAVVGAAGVAGAVLAKGLAGQPVVTPGVAPPLPATGDCTLQTLTVHSRRNGYLLSQEQMDHLQDRVAVAYDLTPGDYILRLKDGVFNYGSSPDSGEPFVLLWIYGGRVINLKTGVPVDATWSTLNGYADTLSLRVDAEAKLRAFFIDTFPENNTDAVTLSVIRL